MKLLKQAVEKIDIQLQEYRDEWKRTGCTIISYRWTNKKKRSICNFLVNIPKRNVFLYSLDTSNISKIAEKGFKMLDDVVEFVGEENVVQVVSDNAIVFPSLWMIVNFFLYPILFKILKLPFFDVALIPKCRM